MKTRLDSGVDKIDKTSDSATSRVESMEHMVSFGNFVYGIANVVYSV